MRKHSGKLLKLLLEGGAIAGFVMSQNAASGAGLGALPLEEAAYYKVSGGAKGSGRDYKSEYLKKLSPGGKAYFLACRRDYKEALLALERVSKRDSGSYYYIKAYCLEGLGKHAEAAKNYDYAMSKIGSDFSPGFRFYLESATAYMRNGEEKKAQKNLDIAGPESEEYGTYQAYPRYVRLEIQKRKTAVIELKGRYKEAFERYLDEFNHAGDQFHLNESLTGDAESQARARVWLSSQKDPPPGKSETELSIFYLTKGKANMVLGNLLEAKNNLERAIHAELRDRAQMPVRRQKSEDALVLLRIKDQARAMLIKIYFKEKDYRKCCQYIRSLYSTEAFVSLDTVYNTIAMHDITQLVTQKDLDLHDPYIEFKLDKSDCPFFDSKTGFKVH